MPLENYWNFPEDKKINIDKYPRLARFINNTHTKFGTDVLFPIKRLKIREYFSVDQGEIVYLFKEGMFVDEALYVPLDCLLDNRISYTAVKRWTRSKNASSWIPYVALSKDFIELL